MEGQDWLGKDLDKDIVKTGNKIYSPETCIFVSHEINSLLTNCSAARGKWPQGVYLNKMANKFQVNCRVNGKIKYLGIFLTPEEASEAYKQFKSNLIRSIAEKQEQPLKGYLIRISKEITT